MNIYIRSGEMVTEDEALTIDWLVYLENLVYLEDFIIDKNYFENERNKLSKRFGMRASVYDTVWKILNFLLIRFATDNSKQTQIHRLMANLLADENRDPTEHLIKSAKFENIANFKTRKEMLESEKRLAEIFPDEYDSESIEKQIKNLKFHELNEENLYESKPLFLGQPQFKYIRRLVKQGKIEDAEELLYKSYPSAAVLEELRKITGKKAWLAKADNDWDSVVKYLCTAGVFLDTKTSEQIRGF